MVPEAEDSRPQRELKQASHMLPEPPATATQAVLPALGGHAPHQYTAGASKLKRDGPPAASLTETPQGCQPPRSSYNLTKRRWESDDPGRMTCTLSCGPPLSPWTQSLLDLAVMGRNEANPECLHTGRGKRNPHVCSLKQTGLSGSIHPTISIEK